MFLLFFFSMTYNLLKTCVYVCMNYFFSLYFLYILRNIINRKSSLFANEFSIKLSCTYRGRHVEGTRSTCIWKVKFTHSCTSGNLLSRSADHEKLLRLSWVGNRAISYKHCSRPYLPRNHQNDDENISKYITIIALYKKYRGHQSIIRYFFLLREISIGMCKILLYRIDEPTHSWYM